MKKLILPISILLGCIVLGGFYYATQINKQRDIEKQQQIDLQTKCADTASKYFISRDNKRSDGNTYENHYNAELNKCFILIYYDGINDDSLFIDLYDAAEGKHYAMYMGHKICDPVGLIFFNDPKRCQSDSGIIWYDGNDTKDPDYTVGFRGSLNGGGVGDENTQKQFIEAIHPFMND